MKRPGGRGPIGLRIGAGGRPRRDALAVVVGATLLLSLLSLRDIS